MDQISEQNYLAFEQAQRLQNEYNNRLAEQREAEKESKNVQDKTVQDFQVENQSDLYNMMETEIQTKLLEELQNRIEMSETDESKQVRFDFANELKDAILEEIEQRLFSDAQLEEVYEGRQLAENEEKEEVENEGEKNSEDEQQTKTEEKAEDSDENQIKENNNEEDLKESKDRADLEDDDEDYDDEDYEGDYDEEDYDEEDYDEEDYEEDQENPDQEVEDQQGENPKSANQEEAEIEDQEENDSKKDPKTDLMSKDQITKDFEDSEYEEDQMSKQVPEIEAERIPENDYDYYSVQDSDSRTEFQTDDYDSNDNRNSFGFLGMDISQDLNQRPGDVRIRIEVEYLNNYAEEQKAEHRGALQQYVKDEFSNFVDNKFKHANEKLRSELKNSVQDHYVEFEGGYGKVIDTEQFESRMSDILDDLSDSFKSEMTSTIDKYERFGNEFENFMNREHEKQLMEHEMYQHVSEMLGLMKYQCAVKDICATSSECGEGCGCTAGACFCCEVALTDYLF